MYGNMNMNQTPLISKKMTVDLNTKMEIIRQYETQQNLSVRARVNNISHTLSLPVSLVKEVIRDTDRLKKYVKGPTPPNAIMTAKKNSGAIHEMEEILMSWIEEQMHSKTPFTITAIQEKARSIYGQVQGKYPNEIHTFSASKSWVHRFKARSGLQGIRFTGENDDTNVVQAFINTLNNTIDSGNYRAEQIFSVIDFGLCWKKLPERTFMSNEAAKDKLTLLLGGNISGDYKLKPLMVYHNGYPQTFYGIDRKSLPVFYCYAQKVWISVPLFKDWFINSFIPEVKKYCAENNIPFKILLLMDDVPGRPKHLNDLNLDVKVVFLPQNAYSQPINQGISSCFRAHYLLQLITYISKMINDNPGRTIQNVLDCYDIYLGILNIGAAWNKVTQSLLKCYWSKLCPRFAQGAEIIENGYELIINEIIQTANILDLKIEGNDLYEYIISHWNNPSNRDVIQFEPANTNEKVEDLPREEIENVFSLNEMSRAFSEIESALKKFKTMDSDDSRFSKVQEQIDSALACYKEIYDDLKKQHSQPECSTSFKPS